MFAGNSSRKRKATSALQTSLKKSKTTLYRGSKSKTLASKVSKLIKGVEIKNLDGTSAPIAMVTTGAIGGLNSIPNGDDSVSRDGRKVTLKALHLRGWYEVAPPSVAQSSRVIIFIDKNGNGATPASTDFLAGGACPVSDQMLLVANRDRFTVLWDSYNGIPGNGVYPVVNANSSAVTQKVMIDTIINLGDREANYVSTATAPPLTNAVWIWVAGPIACSYILNTRLLFTDS